MKNCVIICNPNSGKGNKNELLKKFSGILEKSGYNTKIMYTKYSGNATEIVRHLSSDVDLVISLGGDGTFNEVVKGNLERKNALLLSHIPLGTTNDLGSMFGMGKDPIKNLKMILSGKVKGIDICQINKTPFVYVAALGKFVDIAYDTKRESKKKFGYLAYIINAIKSFSEKTKVFEMEYTVNGETYRGLYSLVLICNATRMGGIDVFNDVKMDDNRFEVLMTNITSKKDILKSLVFLKTSDITKVPGFYFYRTDKIKIKLKERPRKNWCIDGEKLPSKSLEYEIGIIRDVKMLLPEKELNKIFINN
ncbi:MAG: YegS/Rv2252/BmrU family lipid kinase [Bacilli bacterium]|nr:YegS/Rv2252/BmrU family lipid kinase [Bacilli bacterium]